MTAQAENPTDQNDKLTVRVMVDNVWLETKVISVNASSTIDGGFPVNATTLERTWLS